MSKIAFVFPGQGSQEVGMGEDLIKNYKEADKLFNEANITLKDEGVDLKKLCLEGPEEGLTKTINAQPAMLTMSIILYKLLQKNNINPDIVDGHSLGEYSALVAASSIEFKEAVRLVRKRGQYMQTATPLGTGSMAVIISLQKDKIEELIKKVSKFGIIEVVNYNSPYQIVVSGKTEVIEKLLILGEEEIKDALIEQVTYPIKWVDIIKRMNLEGINYFIEVGQGNVLKKLIKQILPKAKVCNVCDSESLEKVMKKLS
jgi:[acyl-carrier-protein] S-malonyltransferase